MGLDIRWPIGLMFTLIGAMLVVFGAITSSEPDFYKASLNINVNLYWGSLLLVFGGWMLIMAWSGAKKAAQAPASQPKA
jgi:hypothetical protein